MEICSHQDPGGLHSSHHVPRARLVQRSSLQHSFARPQNKRPQLTITGRHRFILILSFMKGLSRSLLVGDLIHEELPSSPDSQLSSPPMWGSSWTWWAII
jgi:hypothetical protein